MNALFCEKAKLGAVDALLNDSPAAKSSNPRPQGQGVTILLGERTRVRFRVPPPNEQATRSGGFFIWSWQ